MNYLRYFLKKYLFVLIAIAFMACYWISAYSLPGRSIVFPRFITFITIPIIIWCIIQSITEYRALVRNTEMTDEEKFGKPLNLSPVKIVITGMTALYIALIPVIGYCVTTILYVGGLSYYLGNRKPVKLVAFTLAYFGITYAIFFMWLRIRLPGGLLF